MARGKGKKDIEVTDLEMDALKESVSIGAGNAATALSKLSRKTIHMSIPNAVAMPVADIPSAIRPDAERVVVRINVLGDASGSILITMSTRAARSIADILLEGDKDKVGTGTDQFSQMDISALQEVASIMAGNYLSALTTFTKMDLRSSVPFLAVDRTGDVVKGTVDELAGKASHALVLGSELSEEGKVISLEFFLIPTQDALSRIVAALQKKV